MALAGTGKKLFHAFIARSDRFFAKSNTRLSFSSTPGLDLPSNRLWYFCLAMDSASAAPLNSRQHAHARSTSACVKPRSKMVRWLSLLRGTPNLRLEGFQLLNLRAEPGGVINCILRPSLQGLDVVHQILKPNAPECPLQGEQFLGVRGPGSALAGSEPKFDKVRLAPTAKISLSPAVTNPSSPACFASNSAVVMISILRIPLIICQYGPR